MFKKFLLQALVLVLFAAFAIASSESTHSSTSSSSSKSSSSSSKSLLRPTQMPKSSSDYSYSERMQNSANGYR